MRCLTSARFTMKATVLSQGSYGSDSVTEAGYFTDRQNPLTFEIERVWVPLDSDPVTGGTQPYEFDCVVRGIVDGGIRVAGTTERLTPSGTIESADYARMQFPPNVPISKRDRIYNVKDSNGVLAWKEEEYNGAATVFDVLGVTPIFDPFNNHIENHALLQRADVQSIGA